MRFMQSHAFRRWRRGSSFQDILEKPLRPGGRQGDIGTRRKEMKRSTDQTYAA